MSRIRIAHVITRLCRGGAQENTLHTVRLADRTRFEVDLISGFTDGPEGSLEDRIEASGIRIARSPHLVRPARPWSDIRALAHLTALFRDRQYDIVHTHTSKAGFIGRCAAYRARVPVIVHTPHGHVFDGYFADPVTWLYIRLERLAARWTNTIVALTEDEIETCLRHGIGRRDQFVVIPSGVDLDPFITARAQRDAMRAALGVPEDAYVVGAVGRLEPIKGFDDLISAARDLIARTPHAWILIAGEGSQEKSLREAARNCGDRVRFLGYRDDVADIMAAFDVLAVPSLNEGMGRVVVEAGAAGVPVVASAVGGLPHVVDDGRTGLLVPPRDPMALAEALGTLDADTDTRVRMGNAAQDRMVPGFAVTTMVARIESLYTELFEKARAR